MKIEITEATSTAPSIRNIVLMYEPVASNSAPEIVEPNEAIRRFMLTIG